MRIKYTSLHSVVGGSSTAAWIGAGPSERQKQEALFDREAGKKQSRMQRKRKGEGGLGLLRRSR